MAAAAASTISAVASVPSQLVGSLASLARAEQQYEAKPKLSGKVSWYADVLRFRASTIPRVWSSVLGFTIFSAAVAAGQMTYGKNLRLTNSVVPLLSVIVGLLLVFRNSTAFGRWDDGRKTFGSQTSTIRNLARYAWTNIGAAPYDADRVTAEGEARPYAHAKWTQADHDEKRRALRLMCAFVAATKHHVRGEYGIDYDDLAALLPPGVGQSISIADELRLAARKKAREPTERDALLDDAVFVDNAFTKPSLPLPAVITHRLGVYFAKCRAKGFLDLAGPAGYNTLNNYLNELTNEMGTVERLGSLPIPVVYGIHLKQVVSLFLLVLPFTLVSELTWKLIPFVTIYAFILQGIEAIASEIESPFGDDPSDLPLDLICAELRNEVEHIIQSLPEFPE